MGAEAQVHIDPEAARHSHFGGLVASGCSVVVQVHLRKGDSLYINDGIFHSLSEPFHIGLKLPMRVIRPDGALATDTVDFKIFGPTCDCTDQIPYRIPLPADIREGDWIEIGQLGAYSNSMATRFNGFAVETFVNVDSPPLVPDDMDPVQKTASGSAPKSNRKQDGSKGKSDAEAA